MKSIIKNMAIAASALFIAITAITTSASSGQRHYDSDGAIVADVLGALLFGAVIASQNHGHHGYNRRDYRNNYDRPRRYNRRRGAVRISRDVWSYRGIEYRRGSCNAPEQVPGMPGMGLGCPLY